MSELVKDVIGIASAAIALAAAWVGYRAARQKAIANREAAFNVVKIDDPDVRRAPWNLRRYRWWLAAIGGLPSLILGLISYDADDAGPAIVNIAMGVGVIILMFTLRTEPPSRTRKTLRLELDLPMQTAMAACLRAASDMGAEIATYDAHAGVLIAKTGVTWRSFGEIVTAKAVALDARRCEVQIESDVLQVSTLLDWGANRRNLKRLQSALLGIASSTQ